MDKVIITYTSTYGSVQYVSEVLDDGRPIWSSVPSEAIPIEKSRCAQISMRTPYSFDTIPWTPSMAEELEKLSQSMTFHYLMPHHNHAREGLKTICGRYVGNNEITFKPDRVTCISCKRKIEEL